MAQAVHVSVVLPTYNERDNIYPLIQALLNHLADASPEIIVVDDDSPDGTWQVVAEVAAQDERVRLLRRLDERGLTSAIAAGIEQARGDIVVWMDCDFSMPPEVVPRLVAAIPGRGGPLAGPSTLPPPSCWAGRCATIPAALSPPGVRCSISFPCAATMASTALICSTAPSAWGSGSSRSRMTACPVRPGSPRQRPAPGAMSGAAQGT